MTYKLRKTKLNKGLTSLGFGVAFLAAAAMGDESFASANNSQPAVTLNLGQSLEITTPVSKHITAFDATNGTNAKGTLKAGKYFVYNQKGAAVNLTTQPGKPGAWVKAADLKIKGAVINKAQPSQPVKPQTQQPQSTVSTSSSVDLNNLTNGVQFNLVKDVTKHVSLSDAKDGKNSKGAYKPGKYFIYNNKGNGLVNISTSKGAPGAWVKLTSSHVGATQASPQAQPQTPKPSPDNPKTQPVVTGYTPSQTQGQKVMPVKNKWRITSPYGVSRNISSIGVRDIHNGVDFVTGNTREPILATEDGVVMGAGRYNDGALYVSIKHSDNSYTHYVHLAPNSITVKVGQHVKAGQQVGTMGTTGQSTGIHLHFMHSTTMQWWNSHKDPMKYLSNAKYVGQVTQPSTTYTAPTKPSTPKPIVNTNPSTPTTNVSNLQKGQAVTINSSVTKHITAADAGSGLNSKGNLKAGTYYVYSVKPNGVYNISTVAGQAGSWVKLSSGSTQSVSQPKAGPVVQPQQNGQVSKAKYKFGSDGKLVMKKSAQGQQVINLLLSIPNHSNGAKYHSAWGIDSKIDQLSTEEALWVIHRIEGAGFGQTGDGYAGIDSAKSHQVFAKNQLEKRFGGSVHNLLKKWGTYTYGGY